MISLEGVRFAYRRGHDALGGVSLSLPESGLALVVGPNGAGKSTLLKVMAGVERPDAGTVRIGGLDLWTEERAARLLLAFAPERADLPASATVRECLRLAARLRGLGDEAAEDALRALGLDAEAGRSVQELSQGQRHRALLAAARLGEPRILLLDEPLDALDRGARVECVRWISESLAKGALAVVVTHDLEPFADLASCAVVVRRGEARLVPAPRADRLAWLEALAGGALP